MGGRLGIVACGGALPVAIAAAHPGALAISLAGVPHDMGDAIRECRLERLGDIFRTFAEGGVDHVVLAGALARPVLDPADFDDTMRAAAPRLVAAMQAGDDALLRQVIAVFEENGFRIVGAHDVLPDLTAPEGH